MKAAQEEAERAKKQLISERLKKYREINQQESSARIEDKKLKKEQQSLMEEIMSVVQTVKQKLIVVTNLCFATCR